MEYISVLIGIIAAAAIGFAVGRNFSSGNQEKNRLETELKEKQEELDAFRNKVTNHFEKTADLFNQVSDSYQSLYDHMATSSNQLCSTPTFQSLPQSENELLEPASTAHKTNKDSDNMFDANKLYNAHDYRNQPELDENPANEEAVQDTTNIVDIEAAKEDRNEPALDYAVKKDGVINHNSLDIDGVKTS